MFPRKRDWEAYGKRYFTDPVPRKREEGFARQGISAYHGAARFCGPDMVAVNGSTLKGRPIVIASGARPASLSFPRAEHLTLSDAFMELERLPERIVMVGGGYIAHFDPDLVAWLMKKFKEIGVDARLQNTVTAIERSSNGYRVHTQTPDGEAVVDADLVARLGPTEMSAIWSLSGGKQTFNSTTATAESNNPLRD